MWAGRCRRQPLQVRAGWGFNAAALRRLWMRNRSNPPPLYPIRTTGPRAAGAGAGAGVRARPWEALQRRGLAVETTEPTPVPPPPPAPRNYVYPAVLALTAATVAFVMMT